MKIAKQKHKHIKSTSKERMWAALNTASGYTRLPASWPEMQVVKLNVTAKTRKLAAGWTIETVRDIK